MNRVVITGGTGVIGIALVEECIRQNIEVLLIVRKGSSRLGSIPKNQLINVIECSLCDLETIDKEIEIKYDVFFHLAWDGTMGKKREDTILQTMNIKYSLDAIQLAKKIGCHTFIGAGSQAEYGKLCDRITKDTLTLPHTEYGIAKLTAGIFTRKRAKELGMRHIWVRILSVYGKNDSPETMIMSLIRSLKEGKIPKLTKCEQIWDYLYSEDAAKALILLAEKGINNKVYVLGSGNSRPLIEYVNEVKNIVSPSAELGLGLVKYSDNQIMYLGTDISMLQEDIGWNPRVQFSEGIEMINLSWKQ